jgi:DNA repair protein RadC
MAFMKQETNSRRINDMQNFDRPRERLLSDGVEVLSNAELLAILLGSGTKGQNAIELGGEILAGMGGFQGIHRNSIESLMSYKGVGEAKATRIKAAVELGNRMALEAIHQHPVISSPEDVVRLVGHELCAKEQEELWVIRLDVRNRFLGLEKLYKGTQDSATVRVAEVYQTALRKGAYAIMLVHNHPSGDPTESPEDINLTRAVIEAAKYLDMHFLDHIIIGGTRFRSLKRQYPSLWE